MFVKHLRKESINTEKSQKKFTKYLTDQNKCLIFVKQIGNVRYSSLKK